MSEKGAEIPQAPAVEAPPVAAVEAPAESVQSDELGPEVLGFAEEVAKLREKGSEVADDHFNAIQEAAGLEVPDAQTPENDGAVPYVDPENPDAEPFDYLNQAEKPAAEASQETEEPAAESSDEVEETEEPAAESSTETEEPAAESEDDSAEEDDTDDESEDDETDEDAEEEESEEDGEDDEDKEEEEKEGLTEAEMREIANKIVALHAERTGLQVDVAQLRLQTMTDEVRAEIARNKSRIAEIAKELAVEEGKLKTETESGSNKAMFAGLILAGIAAMVVMQAMRAEAA